MLEGGGIINPGVMRREGGNGREEGVQQREEERGGNWMTLFPLSCVRREKKRPRIFLLLLPRQKRKLELGRRRGTKFSSLPQLFRLPPLFLSPSCPAAAARSSFPSHCTDRGSLGGKERKKAVVFGWTQLCLPHPS